MPTLRVLLTGLPVVVLCLVMQASFAAKWVRYYLRYRTAHRQDNALLSDIKVLSLAMLFTLACNFIQMAIWAGLFVMLGEFDNFPTALYFSGVNFATLGYGDIVMSEHWRLLGALEAATGILMFGVSTSLVTASLIDVLKNRIRSMSPRGDGEEP